MPDAQKIMREERERTLAAIGELPLPEQAKSDVLQACAAIQEAVNQVLIELDRPIDGRVAPTAMRLMADEIERLNKRFVEAGLTERMQ